ncbi:hypothetical protein SLEP1_g11053 [Rubroshorea leprosula]|uniref:Uncharacterized protein n=1 Tax=Rubroshorea leprosula TaxID=152421 RepID=A0AAV5IJC5_9ROSI|nr:hypothetical protein SLEP1_g11053 [Rubroshorea leprosula]
MLLVLWYRSFSTSRFDFNLVKRFHVSKSISHPRFFKFRHSGSKYSDSQRIYSAFNSFSTSLLPRVTDKSISFAILFSLQLLKCIFTDKKTESQASSSLWLVKTTVANETRFPLLKDLQDFKFKYLNS